MDKNFSTTVNNLGCLNGGGQLRPVGDETVKEVLEKVKATYDSVSTREPWENPAVEKLYLNWLGGHDSEIAKKLLHTQYHEIEKLPATLTKW